jgi:hypothetical protein
MLGAAPTTARRSLRANLARRRCGASRGASAMPSSGAFWRIRRHPRAAPLDKEEPRTPFPRHSGNAAKTLTSPYPAHIANGAFCKGRARPVGRREGREPGTTRETRLGALPRHHGTRPPGPLPNCTSFVPQAKGRDTPKDTLARSVRGNARQVGLPTPLHTASEPPPAPEEMAVPKQKSGFSAA